jgi:hypothetical protein
VTLLLSLGAVLLGTTLPLAALALVTRWRLAQGSARQERHRARIPKAPALAPALAPATDEPSQPGLGWVRETIGRDHQLPTQPTTRACPQCGNQENERALFCRRCGTRLRER